MAVAASTPQVPFDQSYSSATHPDRHPDRAGRPGRREVTAQWLPAIWTPNAPMRFTRRRDGRHGSAGARTVVRPSDCSPRTPAPGVDRDPAVRQPYADHRLAWTPTEIPSRARLDSECDKHGVIESTQEYLLWLLRSQAETGQLGTQIEPSGCTQGLRSGHAV